jgi:hypothetical protein
MTRIFLTLFLLLLFQSEAYLQTTPDARYYRQQAVQAYQAKDYEECLENLQKAVALIPDHPTILYNIAAVSALLGRKDESLNALKTVAQMGLYYRAAQNEDFNSIKESEDFKTVLRQLDENRTPKVKSSPAYTLNEKGLIAEGLAYDSVSETLYISSVHKRKIIALGKTGEARTFAEESTGLWSVLGMKVDETHHYLWAVTTTFPQMQGFRKEEDGKSAVLKFDLKTGKLLKKYEVPDNSKKHALGDLTLNKRGEIFATDSLSPAVYHIRPEQDEIEMLYESAPFVSPQGLAFSPDEKHLFIADYSMGVFDFDIRTKKVTKLAPLPGTTMLGIDGLYFYKGSLIGVQNGVNPQRLIRVKLTGDMRAFETFEILESNNPLFSEPTLGVIRNGELLFNANSQWDAINEQGQFTAPDKLQELRILKLKL